MLKGERAEPYLTPSRERRLVCQLCAPRAQREGWIREAAAPEMPARPQRPPERRGLLRRRRRRRRRRAGAPAEPVDEPEPQGAATTRRRERRRDRGGAAARPDPALAAPRSPRQVQGRADQRPAQDRTARSTCSTRSEHPRTVAGLARTLGAPHASAVDLERVRRRGRAHGCLGALLVPVHRRPLRRARAGAAARPGPGAVASCPRRRTTGTARWRDGRDDRARFAARRATPGRDRMATSRSRPL